MEIKTKHGEIHSNESLRLWEIFRWLTLGDKFILKVPKSAPPSMMLISASIPRPNSTQGTFLVDLKTWECHPSIPSVPEGSQQLPDGLRLWLCWEENELSGIRFSHSITVEIRNRKEVRYIEHQQ